MTIKRITVQQLAPSWHDFEVMARTIYGEARDQPLAGQIGVGRVIVNRACIDLGGDGKPDWWGETIAGVCQKAQQFSCWNPADPNCSKLQAVQLGDRVLANCITAAALALAADGPAWLAECTHYHTRGVRPAWSVGRSPAGIIGAHLFYSGI